MRQSKSGIILICDRARTGQSHLFGVFQFLTQLDQSLYEVALTPLIHTHYFSKPTSLL